MWREVPRLSLKWARPLSHRWLLVLCLLGAWALRLYRLDAQSFWYDEAVSAQLAAQSVWDLVRWTAGDIQPPLYYVFLHFWQALAGKSEWALRFLSAWWGTLALPLAYAVGVRFTRSRQIGVIGVVLLAVAPWWVYYSQEARMYTQLVALALLWVYWLLRYHTLLDQQPLPRRARWALGMIALSLLYTHYFGLFLLVVWILWQGGIAFWERRFRVVAREVWAPVGIIVAGGYAAWAPFLWQRFREDASYWSGRLKLGEALRHWAVHMTLGAPETFLEPKAIQWLPLFGLVTGVALLSLALYGIRHSSDRAAVIALVAWWWLPALLIFVLAYRTPKFNPRYIMFVYPAWLLVMAWGAWRLAWTKVRWVLLGSVLVLFLRADYAWFTDPAFTKPDFRGAVRYVMAHRVPDEAVLLVSGHMSPVIAYYAPQLPVVRLPEIDVLDVNQVLGFEVAPRLNEALSGARGAWLILWQDEVVDPMGVVPYLLEQVGVEQPTSRAFWHVRVRHFRFSGSVQVPEQPPVTRPLYVNWGNEVTFLGVTPEEDGTLRFFFVAQRPIERDYRLRLELRDEQGVLWGASDVRPGPYLYPTFRWRPGQVVMGAHPIPVGEGTPAGTYTLLARLYAEDVPGGVEWLDDQGAPQGRDVIIPEIVVPQTRPAKADSPWPEVSWPTVTAALKGDEDVLPLQPVAARWHPPPPWEPGQRVSLMIRWRARRAPTDSDRARLWLEMTNARVEIGQWSLAEPQAPAPPWPPESEFFSVWRWRVPRTVPPGTAAMRLEVNVPEGVGQYTVPVTVMASTRQFTVPEVDYPVNAVLGNRVRLVGLNVDPGQFRPGNSVTVTVVWQALQEMERSYTGFVHLLGPDGRIIAQEDHVPARGERPTDAWIAGEVVEDVYTLRVPPTAAVGARVVLVVGLYDALAPGMPRLPVTQGPGDTAVRVEIPINR